MDNQQFINFITKGADYTDAQNFTPSYNLISTETQKDLLRKIQEQSVLRDLAKILTIGSNSTEYYFEKSGTFAAFVDEVSYRDITSPLNFGRKKIETYEMYTQPKVTQRFLDDAEFDIYSWMMDSLSEAFAACESGAFLYGSGSNSPKGILSYGEDEIERLKVNEAFLDFDHLADLIGMLDTNYLNNATFLMNRATLIELQKIKDNHGRYIYSNSVGEKSGHHIFGIPVVVSNLLKGPSSGSVDIILSDFSKGYAIVDRQDTTVVRDNLTEKPFVKFYATKRVGGDVIEANAIKVLSHKIII